MRRGAALFVLFFWAPQAWAQDRAETLSDIRQELGFVYTQIQELRRELSSSGSAGLQESGGSAQQRLDALETEVRRLTGALEEKQFWVEGIVEDGTRRIRDLAFRLCELEEGCDPFTMDKEKPLGDVSPASTTPVTGGAAAGEGNVISANEGDGVQGPVEPIFP